MKGQRGSHRATTPSLQLEFEKRVLEAKRNAIEENKKIAKESGNKLTQNINKEGHLIGVNNTIENALSSDGNASVEDIRKELFEGDIAVKGGAVQDAIDRGLVQEEQAENVMLTTNEIESSNNDNSEN